MPEKLLNTREVASLLQINDKQVYRLIRSGGYSLHPRHWQVVVSPEPSRGVGTTECAEQDG